MLESTTRNSNFASKGTSQLKIYAAHADGELLMWEPYTTWNGDVAAEMTRKLEAICRKKWPRRKIINLFNA